MVVEARDTEYVPPMLDGFWWSEMQIVRVHSFIRKKQELLL